MSPDRDQPLIIVSNRGPVQFERGEDGRRTMLRGGGGLVTALSGLVSHRDALWIASAMTDEDIAVSAETVGPIEILNDPALGKQLGRSGKEYVRTHFLMPRLLRDWLRIFTDLS